MLLVNVLRLCVLSIPNTVDVYLPVFCIVLVNISYSIFVHEAFKQIKSKKASFNLLKCC